MIKVTFKAVQRCIQYPAVQQAQQQQQCDIILVESYVVCMML